MTIAHAAALLIDRDGQRTEADVQSAVRDVLLQGGIDLGDEQVRLESPASNRRRIDIEVGRTVIEVKRDLRKLDYQQALDQLAGYQMDRQQQRGIRHVGVLTDGVEWYAYLLDPDGNPTLLNKHVLDPTDANANRLLVWLDAMLATRQQIPAAGGEVADRLGAESSSYQADLVELGWLYDAAGAGVEVMLKRELWAHLLHVAFGTALDDESVDARTLFLDHTYLVVLATLIGHEVVGVPVAGQPPADLLSGRLFRDAGIHGVVEQDFFDWVLAADGGAAWVERLARKVTRFDWAEVEHDVLKVLYESVIDVDTRHRLGEYYTPDWLAERLVADTVDDPAGQSVLDPACGSGTFLFHTIRGSLNALELKGTANAEAIDSTCRRVFGVDVHPVAVTLARVTYLLAIGTSRLQHRNPFSVPVYLGDSMRYETAAEYEQTLLSSAAGTGLVVHLVTHDEDDDLPHGLTFPNSVLDDVVNFDRFVDELTRAAQQRAGGAVPDITALLDRYSVPESDRSTVRDTLRKLCELVDDERNHIWGYYTRNLARPYWLSQPANNVDRLVGNVPWLSYRFMPATVGRAFRALAEQRGLWVGGREATHQDLSALFVARSVEQYLTHYGRFGFVTPRSVLTGGSYEGFRRARWTDERDDSPTTTVEFDAAWDLDRIPDLFPVPAAVVRGQRVRNADGPTPMPTDTLVLERTRDGAVHEQPDTTTALHDIPLDQPSVYEEEFRQGATVVPTVLTRVERLPPGALGTPAGTTRVRSARSGLEKPPWKELESLEQPVPDEFLFRLYSSESLLPFLVREPGLAVLPLDVKEHRLLDHDVEQWPHLSQWWREAERIYAEHRGSNAVATLSEQVDYYGKLVSQTPHLPSLRVLFSRSGTHMAAALVHDERGVVYQNLYWRPVESEGEGLYLCGILNAPFTANAIRHLQPRGLFGPRHFTRLMLRLPWPLYDPDDPSHGAVVAIARACRDAAAETDGLKDGYFVTVRRRVRRTLEEKGLLDKLDARVAELVQPNSK